MPVSANVGAVDLARLFSPARVHALVLAPVFASPHYTRLLSESFARLAGPCLVLASPCSGTRSPRTSSHSLSAYLLPLMFGHSFSAHVIAGPCTARLQVERCTHGL